MLELYRQHVTDRAALGIPPLPLSAEQMSELGELLRMQPIEEEDFLLSLRSDRVPPGENAVVYTNAGWMLEISNADVLCKSCSVSHEIHPFIQQCLAARRFALRLFVMSYENLLSRIKRRSGFCSHHELSLSTRDALGTQ